MSFTAFNSSWCQYLRRLIDSSALGNHSATLLVLYSLWHQLTKKVRQESILGSTVTLPDSPKLTLK